MTGIISYELKGCIPVLSGQENVNHVCIERKGCLWLVSSLGRIFKSDTDKETFENMALDNRIDDCSVLGLLADENNVWIITNKKVLQYDIYQEICYEIMPLRMGIVWLMYSDTER
mgnify:CR=1 FL=1